MRARFACRHLRPGPNARALGSARTRFSNARTQLTARVQCRAASMRRHRPQGSRRHGDGVRRVYRSRTGLADGAFASRGRARASEATCVPARSDGRSVTPASNSIATRARVAARRIAAGADLFKVAHAAAAAPATAWHSVGTSAWYQETNQELHLSTLLWLVSRL
jgi:hypothetical protein